MVLGRLISLLTIIEGLAYSTTAHTRINALNCFPICYCCALSGHNYAFIKVGNTIVENIVEAIDSSRKVIIVLTKSYMNRYYKSLY